MSGLAKDLRGQTHRLLANLAGTDALGRGSMRARAAAATAAAAAGPEPGGSRAEALARQYGGVHAGGWVDGLPASWIPWVQLCRLSPPAGLLLIYLPPVFGALHAASATGAAAASVLRAAAALLVAALFGNNFAHAWNDVVDAPLDARMARTRRRPVARGAIAPAAAGLFAAGQAALAPASLLLLLPARTGPAAARASLPALAASAYYPFAKRHTQAPQAVLGFCLTWAVMVGSCAVGAARPWADASTLALLAAALLWVVLFDTVYAHQDVVDDARLGVGSTAVLLRSGAARGGAAGAGALARPFLWALLAGMLAALGLSGFWAGMGAPFYALAVGGCAASVGLMVAAVDLDDPASCWLWFSQGFWAPGLAVVGGLAVEYVSGGGRLGPDVSILR